MEFIIGEKFINLANDKIIYSHTHDTQIAINYINEHLNRLFILITHNSDGKIVDNNPRQYDIDITHTPNNIVKWFGQNVCCNHPKLIPLPIGLENSYCCPNEHKTQKIANAILQPQQRNHLLYINHNVNTNPIERIPLYSFFPWATKKIGSNPYKFLNYINDLQTHKFVLSPEGNGTDTHRTWEALYLGCVPILRQNRVSQFFKDKLPILEIENWIDINPDFLNEQYIRIQNQQWDFNWLDFNYWKKVIYETV